jgi:HK97 family phage portal protein|tara:strand:- start:1308 stop:3356 length:2049 start_codon:yes stop_codon:yes gene_type:complete
MGIFDKFFKGSIQKKESPTVMINRLEAYMGKSTRKYKEYAKEGYQDNAIVHRCVKLISDSASAVKIKVFDGDIELENHELISLLARPNPLQSGGEYFASLYSYLLISGNSYLLRDTENDTPPRELYLLRPDRIKIKSSSSMIPDYYCYVVDGQIVKEYPVDQDTGRSQLKQIKLWNPLDDFYGLSPILASAYNIDQHNLAGLHNVALLKNGCTPSGMLKFEPKDETGMSATLTDDQRARLLEDLEMRFQGSSNSGRPMLLEGNFEYTQLGLNPKDMDFLELLNLSAREIALCFGVPAQLIGIPEANTYSNMETAKLGLYEETVIPLLSRVESDLNEFLSPLYDGDIRIEYDLSSIPAMAEKTKQIYANVSQAVQNGIMTRNEAREKLGLEEIEGADELYIPSNLFPIGEVDASSVQDNDQPVDAEGNEKDYELAYGKKEAVDVDTFTTEEEAQERAEEIGCAGIHSHTEDGQTVYMPCETHEEYESLLADGKALSDLDLVPTTTMSNNAKRGLELRKEYGRGGTSIGVARANQLVSKERLSPDTVLRMYSFFSRHEVDKQGRGFNSGTDGYPSAGKIAWLLWGGDAGFSWSTSKRNQIMKERESKAEADALKVGDMVSWDSSGGRAKGKITKIVRSGKLSVPETSFTLNATEDNPACLIKVYRGDEPTDTIVGHRFKTLRKL